MLAFSNFLSRANVKLTRLLLHSTVIRLRYHPLKFQSLFLVMGDILIQCVKQRKSIILRQQSKQKIDSRTFVLKLSRAATSVIDI